MRLYTISVLAELPGDDLFTKLLGLLGAIGLALIVFAALTGMLLPKLEEHRSQRAKRRGLAREALKRKLDAGIAIGIQDVLDLGRGARVSPADAVDALYELYSETDDKERHSALRKLLDDFSREEPFETLPEEARPSLARISELSAASPNLSDRQLTVPIVKLLEEYQAMKQDHVTIKKQSRRSYVAGIFGAILGVFGIALTFFGPSKSFISTEIRSALKELPAQNQSSGPTAGTPTPVPSR